MSARSVEPVMKLYTDVHEYTGTENFLMPSTFGWKLLRRTSPGISFTAYVGAAWIARVCRPEFDPGRGARRKVKVISFFQTLECGIRL